MPPEDPVRSSLDQFHLTRREFFRLHLLEFFEAITRIKEQRSRRRAPLSASVATTVTLLCSPCVGGRLCLTSGLPPGRLLNRMAGCKHSFITKRQFTVCAKIADVLPRSSTLPEYTTVLERAPWVSADAEIVTLPLACVAVPTEIPSRPSITHQSPCNMLHR